jgi:hypothetical protein
VVVEQVQAVTVLTELHPLGVMEELVKPAASQVHLLFTVVVVVVLNAGLQERQVLEELAVAVRVDTTVGLALMESIRLVAVVAVAAD